MSRKKSLYEPNISQRIKEIRYRLALSGADFADKIGISQGYLSDIENNKASVNKTLLLAISYVYNIDYSYLLSGEPSEKRDDDMTHDINPSKHNALDKHNKLLKMTKDVLDSKTDYSNCLAANICSFFKLVSIDNNKESSNDRTKRLEEKCDNLMDEVARLKNRLDGINRLGEENQNTGRKVI